MAALKLAKQSGARITKTSIMLGCGEQPHEVLHAFRTLRENGTALPSTTIPVCLFYPALFGEIAVVHHLYMWGIAELPHVTLSDCALNTGAQAWMYDIHALLLDFMCLSEVAMQEWML